MLAPEPFSGLRMVSCHMTHLQHQHQCQVSSLIALNTLQQRSYKLGTDKRSGLIADPDPAKPACLLGFFGTCSMPRLRTATMALVLLLERQWFPASVMTWRVQLANT